MELFDNDERKYIKRLLLSRMRILCNNGFYGLLLMHMIFSIDENCETAATDGERIFFNPKFLDELDFQTKVYTKKDLKNDEYIDQNPEAKLAKAIFGDSKNVGTAKIGMDVVNSKKWQEKMQNTVKKFNEKGIVLEDSKSK